jgi:Domain of unknown function (DUF4878)
MKMNGISLLVVIAIVTLGCAVSRRSTPTATLRAFYDAAQRKDVPGMKKALSKRTLQLFDQIAIEQHKSLEEIFTSGDRTSSALKMPETRNEETTGDTATVETRYEGATDWSPMPFVKEDGEWKIAFDRLIEQIQKAEADGPRR